MPCIAGWFEETEYNCSACKRLVAKKDDNGMIDEQYLEERRAKYKIFGSWSVEEWYPFGVDEREQGRAGGGNSGLLMGPGLDLGYGGFLMRYLSVSGFMNAVYLLRW